MSWLFLGLFGLIVNVIARKNGFYSLVPQKPAIVKGITIKHVLSVFAIYLATSFFVPSLLATLTQINTLPKLAGLTWIQAFTVTLTLLLLYLYCKTLNPSDMKTVWKSPLPGKKTTLINDFSLGVLCWFLTFPFITLLGHILDILVHALFGLEHYEQGAIRFLKMAAAYPPLLIVAFVTIVIIAPVVEEFLFRGVLQTWIKGHVGRKAAITLSSFSFALFHLAPAQKMGNIPLFLSLFAFACFLGFLYEKRRSLPAPIGLHMAFNLMSSLRVILLLQET